MFISCWSAKGGAGTTVVTAGLGLILTNPVRSPLHRSSRHERSSPDRDLQALADYEAMLGLTLGDTLLVDLAGDLPAVLGMPEPSGPGITEWLGAGADVAPDGLARIELPVSDRLSVIPKGNAGLRSPDRAEVLAELLGGDPRHVIVDCGRLDVASDPTAAPLVPDEAAEVVRVMVTSASQSLLVTRSCYLSLRRYLRLPIRPSGVVLLTEPGRSLSALDVEEVCEAPVVAEVAVDASIARAVDSGLLSQRVPRGLARALLRAA